MKTAVEQFIEQLETPKYQDVFGFDFVLTINKDKSKTALMPNKKNHYSQEYLNKIQDENN